MERNENDLKQALARLPSFQPAGFIWTEIARNLDEQPLQQAIKNLPAYETDDFVWENIEEKIDWKKNGNIIWWYAAAMILAVGFTGFLYNKNKADSGISYSQEVIDARLQTRPEPVTDQQYAKIVSYCESETVVCSDKNFSRLKREYETLRSAAQQLQKAMGSYNTEPELSRQFSIVEQEKAQILNEMAKMI